MRLTPAVSDSGIQIKRAMSGLWRQSEIELSNPKNGRQQLEILRQRSKSVDSEKQRLQLSDRLGKRKGQASDMHLRGGPPISCRASIF